MLHRLFRYASVCLVAAGAMAASACSGSVNFSFGGQTPADAAVELIEGDAMAQRLGLPSITDAICDDPSGGEIGTTFSCTANSDGQTVHFDVLIEDEDSIFASPNNVVDSFALTRLESAAVQALNDENDFGLPTDAIDCGDRSVVLDADRQLTCSLTDPESDARFDAEITVTDTQTGAFSIEIVAPAE